MRQFLSRKSQKKSEKGFIIIGIVLAVSISVSIIFYFLQSLVLGLNREVQQQHLTDQLDQYRISIMNAIENGGTLGASIAANNELKLCLSSPTVSCNKAGGLLRIVTPSGKNLLNPTDPELGMNVRTGTCTIPSCAQMEDQNATCSGFTSGDSRCPVRFVSKWVPMCPVTGNCIRPPIVLRVELEVGANPHRFVINPARYFIEKSIR